MQFSVSSSSSVASVEVTAESFFAMSSAGSLLTISAAKADSAPGGCDRSKLTEGIVRAVSVLADVMRAEDTPAACKSLLICADDTEALEAFWPMLFTERLAQEIKQRDAPRNAIWE